ncbi:hypothetical protein M405DRAFT_930246 [Rhizopogon salebrosus TDB-379]|nr:hypothetical protein M405DRAFT_930246 [Rhizopogon salebrosus TDB-379]
MLIRKQKAESGEVEVDPIDAKLKQGIVRSFTHLHSGDRIALAPIPANDSRRHSCSPKWTFISPPSSHLISWNDIQIEEEQQEHEEDDDGEYDELQDDNKLAEPFSTSDNIVYRVSTHSLDHTELCVQSLQWRFTISPVSRPELQSAKLGAFRESTTLENVTKT